MLQALSPEDGAQKAVEHFCGPPGHKERIRVLLAPSWAYDWCSSCGQAWAARTAAGES
jgi:hypothetical protein